jgi:hypothetical protein
VDTLAFDGYRRLGLVVLRTQPGIKAAGASVHRALDDPQEIEHWGSGLKLIAERDV